MLIRTQININMKRIFYLVITTILLLPGITSIQAQNEEETDFWLTFGANSANNPNLQICIISQQATKGIIYFTDLRTSIDFDIAAQQRYDYTLTDIEKQAVLNTTTGVSDRSIRITSEKPIMVYAMNQAIKSTDATNILPVMNLGTEYYQISYTPALSDAYAIIATENNTHVSHNGVSAATLHLGQVYYRSSNTDMTGTHITTNHPVAFFALNQSAQIPVASNFTQDCLMQQLPPVEAWEKEFFVPVSNRTRDVVRIVASEDNTNITQIGGRLLSSWGAQTSLTNLQAGQFVELEVSLDNNGCYIQANKPVGVCTYLTSANYNGGSISDPAQSWLSPIEQNNQNNNIRISPFIPTNTTSIDAHYAIIVTSTATKNNTRVSIDGASHTALSGGSWRDNAAAGMSFYTMPLTNTTASYHFVNRAGLIVMCYGTGDTESYYYPASSIVQDATFYANDIDYTCLTASYVFCTSNITFDAEIKGLSSNVGSLRWYIDEMEIDSVQDRLTWSRYFPSGEYEIKLVALFDDENSVTLEGILNIGAQIEATALPVVGGSILGNGCYMVGEEVSLTAIANLCYEFLNWTENGSEVHTNASYTFIATESRTLVANFGVLTPNIAVSPNPENGGTVSGGNNQIPCGSSITVLASPSAGFNFHNWTKNGVPVSVDTSYTFPATESCTLVANFTHNITLLASPAEGGTVSGGGNHISHLTKVTALATAHLGYHFINWTENGSVVDTNASYEFTATESRTLIANFEKIFYTINVVVNDTTYGYVTGAGIYAMGANVTLEAFANECYHFVNWTLDSVEVSTDNPYVFLATENVNLTANFYALDFDSYVFIIWDNTFLLNLKMLAEEGYEVIGCKWFKNGIEEKDTHTISEYSYSAGPNASDLLEPEATYMFQLITKNYGILCSSNKTITNVPPAANSKNLFIYPNPVLSGSPLTIKGVIKDDAIRVYNQYGACVGSATADSNITTLTLNLPAGVYWIRINDKNVKAVIVQ